MDVQTPLIRQVLTAPNDKLVILYGNNEDFVVKLVDIVDLKFDQTDYIFAFARWNAYTSIRDSRCRIQYARVISEAEERKYKDPDNEDKFHIDPKKFDEFIFFNRKFCMMIICSGGVWFRAERGPDNFRWHVHAHIMEAMCRKEYPAPVKYVYNVLFGDGMLPATHDTQYHALMTKRELTKRRTQLKNLPATKRKLEAHIEAAEAGRQRLLALLNSLPNVQHRLECDIASLDSKNKN